MRIDCYNATECLLAEVMCGDTFYFDGGLCIKVAPMDVDVFTTHQDRCFVVELATGALKSVKSEAVVIMADTKVVANNAV